MNRASLILVVTTSITAAELAAIEEAHGGDVVLVQANEAEAILQSERELVREAAFEYMKCEDCCDYELDELIEYDVNWGDDPRPQTPGPTANRFQPQSSYG